MIELKSLILSKDQYDEWKKDLQRDVEAAIWQEEIEHRLNKHLNNRRTYWKRTEIPQEKFEKLQEKIIEEVTEELSDSWLYFFSNFPFKLFLIEKTPKTQILQWAVSKYAGIRDDREEILSRQAIEKHRAAMVDDNELPLGVVSEEESA